MVVSRFAPSPTGHLHLGHAFSALFAEKAARSAGGKFLLRIEDIDPVRCKPEFSDDLIEDLKWLGLKWDGEIRKQSEHMDDYKNALSRLKELGVLYPCFCTRSEVAAEIASAGQAPHGADGPLYPGVCRKLSVEQREEFMEQRSAVWRLDSAKAKALVGNISWKDKEAGEVKVKPELFGDVVLARKDVPTSYHLSVTVDDYLQGVTLVTRGNDLFNSTSVHRLLQALLDYPVPEYHHHKLLLDETGKRFAKRDKAATLRAAREGGMSAKDVRDSLMSLAR
ncbi:MAG: tRNA glutamyl-Q(34) synthetase GluQRS [Alphaproteobacteria bacterium]|nr:tRNA glutamyl-Q(34) synthetase GluQRS [Alphaproteobacteria bacterium]